MENPAFETVEDIDRVEHKHEYERKSAVQAFEEPEEVKCQFLGFLPIPKICQKWFLTAPWILVFLSFASTIQVRFFLLFKFQEIFGLKK